MTKNEKKLRLRGDEVVHCATYELACKCCELADSLRFTWWSGNCYLNLVGWAGDGKNTLYDFHGGSTSHLSVRKVGRVPISAEEWLNRHGIFMFGQDVLVRDNRDPDVWKRRRYVAPHYATHLDLGELDTEGSPAEAFTVFPWCQMKSPYPEWVDEEDHVITIDGKEVILSKESYEALKKSVEKN